ncbi:MAG: hypothetical protein U0L20_08355 [Ruminococcus sp.]|nr:hypothetical protein [Ruminococcus sp.]
MKKMFSIMIVIIFIIFSAYTVSANTDISFSCSDASCQINRLVEIEVTATSVKKLCAAYFEFSIDRNLFEYRKVKATNKNTTVRANDDGKRIKIMFLNTWGENISDDKPLFTITLKAINYGNSYINFTVEECVDENLKFIEIGNCKAAKIEIKEKSNKTENKTDYKFANSANSIKTSKNSESTKEIATTIPIIHLGTVSADNNFLIYTLVGSVITLCITATIFMINMIIKSNTKNKDDGKLK